MRWFHHFSYQSPVSSSLFLSMSVDFFATTNRCLVSFVILAVKSVIVEVGDFTRYGGSKQKISASATIHRDYDHFKYKNDIAVVTLSEPVDRSRVISLCDRNYERSTLAVCGMGLVDVLFNSSPEFLQEAQLQEVGPSQCFARDWSQREQICAHSAQSSACMGDSGGPLFPVSGGRSVCVYGVVSFGDNKCRESSVYTRVSAYAGWIRQQM